MVRWLFRLRPVVLLALVGILLAPASAAFAGATVGISGGVLTYTAGAGDSDTPSFQRNTAAGDYMYVSSGAGSTQLTAFAGGLCQQIDATDVRCPTGSYTSILANLGDQADDVHQVAFGPDPSFFRPITLNGDADPDHLEGGNGNDTINGGAGNDVLTAFGGHDALTGGDGGDQFYVEPGDSGAHSYDGGPGNDTFTGGAGNETFAGGDDADTIDGGAGNDTIDGGPGPDQMSGDGAAVTGGAFDAVTYQSRAAPVRVTLEESGDPDFSASNDGENGEGDRVAPDVEIVRGGSGSDQLFGNSRRNELHGGDGSDAIDGGANNDTLYGDGGSDQITGGPGNDTIIGGPGDDIINARDGEADSISCGDGADRANVDEFDTVAPDCFEGGGGGPGPGGGAGPGAAPPAGAQPPGFATPPPSPSAASGCLGQVTLGPITALGVCFKKDGGMFVASAGQVGTMVRINGIDVALGSGAKLVVDPQGQRISATGSVQVKVGPIVLLSGAFDWNVKSSPLEFQAGGDTTIAGLPISGRISVRFGGGADLKLSVKLPAIFGGFTGDAEIHVDNALGITLKGLHIAVDHGFLGALEIENLLLDYQAAGKDWKGAVDILIPTPGRPELKGSIEIDGGRLVSATVSGTGLDLPLAPALALQSLDAAVTASPYFSLSGTIGLTAGPKIGPFAALRSSGSFLYARGEDIPPSPLVPFRLHGAVIAVDGKIVIVNAITVDGRLIYSPGRIAASTSLLIGNHALGVEGSASGWVTRDAFSLEGSAKVYALGLQLQGTAVLSSKGLAGCAQVGPFSGGVGRVWGQPLKAFAGCDLGPYKPAGAQSASAAATGQVFRVAARTRGLSLAVHGNGAPPKITVTGPGGVSVSTAADTSPTRSPKVIIAQDPQTSTTYALLLAPAAGSWQVTANDGSAAIRSVERSDALPDPAVTARVTGRGAKRVLAWRIKPIPGQRVTFEEDSHQTAAVLATATGGSGTKRFAPAEGVAGRRNIVAIVEQDGLPRRTIVVAHYQASAPPAPPRPRRVTLRRSGTSLAITWTPVALAARYALRVSVSDGRRLILLQPGRRATVPGVSADESATVSVRGLTKSGRQGPAAGATLVKNGRKGSS